MAGIKIVPLGAGQDVGRSCVLVTIGGKNVMFDCGMHMGYQDERRFPDFNYISRSGEFDKNLDCIIISHFHLDHCGALPHFTEICGYSGPIYMTYPTKAICPILLEDMRKVATERKGEKNFFTSDNIRNCMKKVIPIDLHQVIKVDDELEIKAYYAGHVLGAGMFHIKVGNESVVYTGDYNMTPDRHLGAAWIDKCRPDLLITETTYATTTRESKRTREHDFLRKVHDCVRGGGKVLIPVFALGRAQELCILLEAYWERMEDLRGKVSVYFSAGMTERANEYYKLFINWTNEKIKTTFVDRNMFDFKYIKTYQQHFGDEPGPMVVFASPGMLHAGTSLSVFKKWCHDPKNMVILPGYCVAGTVGAKVLAGEKEIQIDARTRVQCNLQVENLSFSAHADAKGIMQLIKMCAPKNVLLVHGEKNKMVILKKRIERELGIPTFDPANGEQVVVGGLGDKTRTRDILISGDLVRKAWASSLNQHHAATRPEGSSFPVINTLAITGTLYDEPGQPVVILPPPKTYQEKPRQTFSVTKQINPFPLARSSRTDPTADNDAAFLPAPPRRVLSAVRTALAKYVPGAAVALEQSKDPSGADDALFIRNGSGSILPHLAKPSVPVRHEGKGKHALPDQAMTSHADAVSGAPFCVVLRMMSLPACAVVVTWDQAGEDAAAKVLAVLNAVF